MISQRKKKNPERNFNCHLFPFFSIHACGNQHLIWPNVAIDLQILLSRHALPISSQITREVTERERKTKICRTELSLSIRLYQNILSEDQLLQHGRDEEDNEIIFSNFSYSQTAYKTVSIFLSRFGKRKMGSFGIFNRVFFALSQHH